MKPWVLLWESLRPKQWTKNLFIFAALLFSRNVLNSPLLLRAIFAFLVFCFVSGCMYILNDISDLEQDKRHKAKSRRPLASGRLKVPHAVLAVTILIPLLLVASYYLGLPFFAMTMGYFLLQVAYSFVLKNIIILDVFAIACGFVLRVIAGGVVIGVEISSWLIICTILLALFLGFSKRRHELTLLEQAAQKHRKVLGEYSPYLLDQMISVVTASTVVAYALYTMSPETIAKFDTRNLIFTVPFVLYGVFRYLYLIHRTGAGGSPERILVTDKPLLVDIFLWVAAAAIIIYGRA